MAGQIDEGDDWKERTKFDEILRTISLTFRRSIADFIGGSATSVIDTLRRGRGEKSVMQMQRLDQIVYLALIVEAENFMGDGRCAACLNLV